MRRRRKKKEERKIIILSLSIFIQYNTNRNIIIVALTP